MNGEHRLLFEGKDVTAHVFDHGPSDKMYLTFSPWTDHHPQLPFGYRLFMPRRISFVTFMATSNNWYQTEEITEAIAAANAELGLRGTSRRVGYGSSMGAFAALTFSRDLGLTDVLAFSPQFSINPREPPYDGRWEAHGKRLTFIHKPAGRLSDTARIRIYFGGDDAMDRAQAEAFGVAENIKLVEVQGGRHPISKHLQQIGRLTKIVLSLGEEPL